MNFFQLVFKQMRQRALSTWLTLLSVLLGVGLAIAVMVLRRESQALFGQGDFGYDIIIGPKGSSLQLVLSTIYQVERSQGNIPYEVYNGMLRDKAPPGELALLPMVKIAVPYAVGDVYKGHRIIGTSTKLFGLEDPNDAQDPPEEGADKLMESAKPLPPERVLEYRPGEKYQLAEGHIFGTWKFEAIVGSDVPNRAGLILGSKFKATHEGGGTHEHGEEWTVVGVLKPTHTASDRLIFIPLTSFYAIGEHQAAMEQQDAIRRGLDPNMLKAMRKANARAGGGELLGPTSRPTTKASATAESAHHDDEDEPYDLENGVIHLKIPRDERLISAILAKSRGTGINTEKLIYLFRSRDEAMAVNPARVMFDFFHEILDRAAKVLLLISALVTVVAAVGILVSIYNSVSARTREIAILRALGATRLRILGIICFEAGVIGLAGGLIGILLGHGMCGIASAIFYKATGQSINWLAVGPSELLYLLVVVALAVGAGLIPALKAYRTPVATNLVAG